jgi:hypothetical protein
MDLHLAEEITLSGKRTVNGWRSGEAHFNMSAEGAKGDFVALISQAKGQNAVLPYIF